MTLEVDNTAFNKKLQIISEESQEHAMPWLQKNFGRSIAKPSKRVEPFPGVCIKTWLENGDKVFINICHSKDICAPEDISDDKFREIMMEDTPSFIIPMALGLEKLAKDKDDVERLTFDILISTEYFQKCKKKEHFMDFTVLAILESINDKYNKTIISSKYVILRNRKVMGSLDAFNIEDREPKKPSEIKKPLIQILDNNEKENSKKSNEPKVTVQSTINTRKNIKYQNYMFVKTKDQEALLGFFYLSSSDITDIKVDVGDNRVIIEIEKTETIIDTFVPESIDDTDVTAVFDSKLHILKLSMPLKKT